MQQSFKDKYHFESNKTADGKTKIIISYLVKVDKKNNVKPVDDEEIQTLEVKNEDGEIVNIKEMFYIPKIQKNFELDFNKKRFPLSDKIQSVEYKKNYDLDEIKNRIKGNIKNE